MKLRNPFRKGRRGSLAGRGAGGGSAAAAPLSPAIPPVAEVDDLVVLEYGLLPVYRDGRPTDRVELLWFYNREREGGRSYDVYRAAALYVLRFIRMLHYGTLVRAVRALSVHERVHPRLRAAAAPGWWASA